MSPSLPFHWPDRSRKMLQVILAGWQGGGLWEVMRISIGSWTRSLNIAFVVPACQGSQAWRNLESLPSLSSCPISSFLSSRDKLFPLVSVPLWLCFVYSALSGWLCGPFRRPLPRDLFDRPDQFGLLQYSQSLIPFGSLLTTAVIS